MPESFLTRSENNKIRYEFIPGTKNVTLVFLHGLLSSHKSVKADCVRQFAIRHSISFLTLDYTSHGESSGKPSDFRVGQCFHDALDVIRHILGQHEKMILVGSSLGGWIALLLAQHLKERVLSVIGLAAAPDFTQRVWDDIFTDRERSFLKSGAILGPNEETKGYCFSYDMFQEAEQHLLLKKRIAYSGPVVLIQGDNDSSVPPNIPFKTKDALDSTDVIIHLIKGGTHALSRPFDLKQIEFILQQVCSF